MRTILICHAGSRLTRYGFASWLSSFSDLVGIVEIRERGARTAQRIKSEIRRVGVPRFAFDVIPYRIYNRLFDASSDRGWEAAKLADLLADYPRMLDETEVLVTDSPNSKQVRDFIHQFAPDMIIARCKTLLSEEIFSIPVDGTFVFHPGVCPEYRNAHGCFWALANDEPDMVGMTLLKIDSGIDTGPVFGYYSYPFDAARETPSIIHNRVIYDNLEALRSKLEEIHAGTAEVIDTDGRRSGVWGQPWLSSYLRIKRKAKAS